MNRSQPDTFICHASDDKEAIAQPIHKFAPTLIALLGKHLGLELAYGARPRGAGNEPLKPSRWTSGGLEPCRCSRPVRDAAPQSLPQSSAVTGSRPTLALVYMLGQLQRIQPEALDAPDFVGIGAKPARQDGRRGPRSSRSGPPLLPLRALDAVLCAHRPAKGVNWIGRSSSPGPPTIRTLGADGRQSTPAPSALQCDSRTQSNGRSVVARSCPLRLVLLFVEPMQATRMSSKDASSVGRPSARSHASLLAHHLKRSAYTSGEGTSFGSLFDGVGENDGR